jgi:hypothetical protein
MKDAYYFSHDSGAHKDPKIIQLRTIHGWAGYGIFWAIIETLRDQSKWKWEATLKQGLSIAIGGDEKQISSVIETLLELKLLEEEKGYIFAPSLTRRMKDFEKKRARYVENGRKGGIKSGEARLQPSLKQGFKQNASNAQALKQSKVKQSKEIKRAEFFSFFLSDLAKKPEDIFYSGTDFNKRKIAMWKMFEPLGYTIDQCKAYYERLHDRSWTNKDGDPYTVKMLVDEVLYYHKRGWLKTGADDESDSE